MSTLIPPPPYTAPELATLYPPTLKLQQVQILLRHGERTPVSARFKNTGLATYWPYCSAANSLHSVILYADHSWSTLDWKRRLETFGPGDTPELVAKGADAVCQPGELTDKGRETTLALGERIRKLYVEQLKFLPPTFDAAESIYLRATPIPRALESVQQAFTGLYPPSTRAAGLPPPQIVQRLPYEETLFPNEGACKRFAELANLFADRSAVKWNDSAEMEFLNSKLGSYMPAKSPKVKVDSHPRLSGIMDTINATLAHGPATRLPGVFYEEEVIKTIDRVCVEEWFAGYPESKEYRALGIGAAMGDVTQRMVEHATATGKYDGQGEAGFKMSLSGCHDTTLAAAITSLGVFDTTKDRWPNYTSSVAFELFKRDSPPSTASASTQPAPTRPSWWNSLFSIASPAATPSTTPVARTPSSALPTSTKSAMEGHYVRLRYNDRPVTLPYCAAQPDRHLEGNPQFCTLAAFKEATDAFTPKDWKGECVMNLGKPADVVERPPGL